MEEIETWRCRVACAPLRKEKSDKSEMVNQVLFGEGLEILEEHGNWVRVKLNLMVTKDLWKRNYYIFNLNH